MPIYYGSQKVKPSGIKDAYYGSVKVYNAVRLPAEYQEVEYIESSGTQYIRTGVTQAQLLRVVLDAQATYYTGSNEYSMGILRAYRVNGNMTYCRCVPYYVSVPETTFGMGGGTQYLNTGITIDQNRHVFEVDNPNLVAKLDNTTVSINAFTTVTEDESNKDFILFARREYDSYSNNIQYNTYSKLYSCKIWKSGILIRDYVPCYRIADGVIGLYDLVNNTFYTNSGSGTFTKGSDI